MAAHLASGGQLALPSVLLLCYACAAATRLPTPPPTASQHLEFMTDVTEQMLRATNEASYVARRADAMRRQREDWIARRVSLARRCARSV